MEINTFLEKIQSYQSPLVFNPWSEYDTSCDIGAEAPVIRSANLRRYLELRQMRIIFLLLKHLATRAAIFPVSRLRRSA